MSERSGFRGERQLAIICAKSRTVYLPVPKIASTSLKYLFWRLNNHRYPTTAFGRFLDMRLANHHGRRKSLRLHAESGYLTVPYEHSAIPGGYESFAVVRDPVHRLKSAWKSKANAKRFRHDGSAAELEAIGLSLEPDFATFLRSFEDYARLSRVIRIHTLPYAHYLGDTPGNVDRLFRIESIGELEEWFSERAGFPITVERQNKSPAAPREDRLGPLELERLRKLTQADYAFLGHLYDFDKAAGRL